jgi:hypothetical protein
MFSRFLRKAGLRGTAPGARTKPPDDAAPVKSLLGRRASPAAFSSTFRIKKIQRTTEAGASPAVAILYIRFRSI